MDKVIDKNTCVCGCSNFIDINMFVKFERVHLTNSGNGKRYSYQAKACVKCGTVKFLEK